MRASCISAVDYYVRGQPQPLELLTVVDGTIIDGIGALVEGHVVNTN